MLLIFPPEPLLFARSREREVSCFEEVLVAAGYGDTAESKKCLITGIDSSVIEVTDI
jgi:hypothetical protein